MNPSSPMTKILLDTNAYSGFMAGDQIVFDYIVESEVVFVSTVMLGELFAGFQRGGKFSANKQELKIFMSKDGVKILLDINRVLHSEELVAQLRLLTEGEITNARLPG